MSEAAVLVTSMLLLLVDLVASVFISEPVNLSVLEGDSIRFNCTRTMNDGIAVWIIDGLQYYWADFKSIEQYTFNRADNSLTINNSPRKLDGTSYQCVLNQEESNVGYLKVLYELSSTALPISTMESETSSSDVVYFINYTSLATLNTAVIASTSVGGILFICAVCCIVFMLKLYKSKLSTTPEMVEHFNMVKNETYEDHKTIMTRNTAYGDPSYFLREP